MQKLKNIDRKTFVIFQLPRSPRRKHACFIPTRRPSISAILASPKAQAIYLKVSFQSYLSSLLAGNNVSATMFPPWALYRPIQTLIFSNFPICCPYICHVFEQISSSLQPNNPAVFIHRRPNSVRSFIQRSVRT